MSTRKKVKARYVYGSPSVALGLKPQRRIIILPATPEAYEAMVEQMARAIFKHDDPEGAKRFPNLASRSVAVAALAAIGIAQPKKTK